MIIHGKGEEEYCVDIIGEDVENKILREAVEIFDADQYITIESLQFNPVIIDKPYIYFDTGEQCIVTINPD